MCKDFPPSGPARCQPGAAIRPPVDGVRSSSWRSCSCSYFIRRLEHRGSSSGRRPGQAWLSAIRHRPSQSASSPPTDCRDDHAASTLQDTPKVKCYRRARRLTLHACATSRPSTPSCDRWRLFAMRLRSGVGGCCPPHRWTSCSMSVARAPVGDRRVDANVKRQTRPPPPRHGKPLRGAGRADLPGGPDR